MGTKNIVQNEPRNPRAPVTGSSSPKAGPEDPPEGGPAKTAQPAESAPESPSGSEPPVGDTPASPAWAKDLRQLYDAVVEEPLPDSFIDLLSQLDAED
jgi:Anti-sigma factor NepR